MTNEPIYCKLDEEAILNPLKQIVKKTKNIKPLMQNIGKIMQNSVDENFETEGRSSGQKWEGWSDPYSLYRLKKKKGSGKILSFEGELREGIGKKVTNEEAIVYSDKEYSAIHNFGGDIKRDGKTIGQMPQRPFMVWSDELKSDIIEELKDYMGPQAQK